MLKRNRKGYKVCSMRNGHPESAYTFGKVVDYTKGKWVSRPEGCGPLVLFDSIKNVELFLSRNECINRCYVVYKSRYKESIDKQLWGIYNLIFKNGLPKGTLFADKIKMIYRECV